MEKHQGTHTLRYIHNLQIEWWQTCYTGFVAVCLHVWMCIFFKYFYVCVCVCICIHLCVFVSVYICVCLYTCMHVCVYMFVCVCVYTHVYVRERESERQFICLNNLLFSLLSKVQICVGLLCTLFGLFSFSGVTVTPVPANLLLLNSSPILPTLRSR